MESRQRAVHIAFDYKFSRKEVYVGAAAESPKQGLSAQAVKLLRNLVARGPRGVPADSADRLSLAEIQLLGLRFVRRGRSVVLLDNARVVDSGFSEAA